MSKWNALGGALESIEPCRVTGFPEATTADAAALADGIAVGAGSAELVAGAAAMEAAAVEGVRIDVSMRGSSRRQSARNRLCGPELEGSSRKKGRKACARELKRLVSSETTAKGDGDDAAVSAAAAAAEEATDAADTDTAALLPRPGVETDAAHDVGAGAGEGAHWAVYACEAKCGSSDAAAVVIAVIEVTNAFTGNINLAVAAEASAANSSICARMPKRLLPPPFALRVTRRGARSSSAATAGGIDDAVASGL